MPWITRPILGKRTHFEAFPNLNSTASSSSSKAAEPYYQTLDPSVLLAISVLSLVFEFYTGPDGLPRPHELKYQSVADVWNAFVLKLLLNVGVVVVGVLMLVDESWRLVKSALTPREKVKEARIVWRTRKWYSY